MHKRLFTLSVILSLASASYGEGRTCGADPEPVYGLAFASFAPLNTDIFVADADGANPRPLLAHPSLDYNASFSRDGKWIVFTSERRGSADIYRVRLNGSGLERVVGDPAFDDQGALSPDGKSLAFVSSRSGQADVWALALASGKLRNITNHAAGDFRPSWSADGRWLAFSSDRDSKRPKGSGGFETSHSTEIYLVRADGSGLRRVTRGEGFAGSPAWSPDGKRLAFNEAEQKEVSNIVAARRLRGSTQIATVDVETAEQRVLTAGAGEKWSPRWLAEGRVAYASGGPEGGLEYTDGVAGARGQFGCPGWSPDAALHPHNPQPYGEIYVMRADGSDARRLTDNQFEEATPSWVPPRRKRGKTE
jgi:Tol biopolymer transport system component